MSETPYAFKVGDKVVLTYLGPDQPEGVVTGINALRTYPLLYTVSVAFESGQELAFGPACLHPASEKAVLPVPLWLPEPQPFAVPTPTRSPQLTLDWEEDISEAALAEAVADWEHSVGCIESGFDYSEDIEEYQLDIFAREEIHTILLGFASLNMPVSDALATRIASTDRRYLDLTVEGSSIYAAWDHDPMAFWYYFRWPRKP